jgi:hypothetical protein
MHNESEWRRRKVNYWIIAYVILSYVPGYFISRTLHKYGGNHAAETIIIWLASPAVVLFLVTMFFTSSIFYLISKALGQK